MILKENKKGFTLIELIVVISIFVIMSGTIGMSLSSFISKNQLETSTQQIVQVLRRAQSYSMMRIKDDQWGVYFDDDGGGPNQSFTFFKGSTYGVDTSYDDVYELENNLSFSNINLFGGGDEVVFSKVTGETSQAGFIDLAESAGNFYMITINDLGQIEVN
jgi:prepilin-type N-terminal cleavage/methylation domain-containing protein